MSTRQTRSKRSKAAGIPLRYEADNGPLTAEQLAAIAKLVPQGRIKPAKRLF